MKFHGMAAVVCVKRLRLAYSGRRGLGTIVTITLSTRSPEMTTRLDFYNASPEGVKALIALDASVSKLGLEPSLIDLVKLRASQINGCAYCIDVHTREARDRGEAERRLYLLASWREAPLFTDRERAALAWTEALTLIASSHAPDADYAAALAQFSEAELVNLSLAVVTINAWNRLGIGFRKSPQA
jgi:AhpD family alkylhydroperoxidase